MTPIQNSVVDFQYFNLRFFVPAYCQAGFSCPHIEITSFVAKVMRVSHTCATACTSDLLLAIPMYAAVLVLSKPICY